MNILALGTIALDTVKTPSERRENILGGSAVHFAMAARHFMKVTLVSAIGEDFPREHLDFLKKKGINLDAVARLGGNSFRWEGEYKKDFNVAITHHTELGVLPGFKPRLSAHQKNTKTVFLANLDPDIQASLLRQLYSPRLVGLDSMNYWITHKPQPLKRLMKKVDIYFCNDAEAKSLSQEHNLFKASRALRKLGPKIVIIKKGEHGVLLSCNNSVMVLPAYPVKELIDPTGAGDSFAGGFLGYLANAGRISLDNLKKALVLGTVIASFNVESFGMKRTARLNKREINQRLKKFKEIIPI
ncbi:MAG: PfkB family carbohydrate kinase [Candidatus Omnitrophota bacterium]